jgi:hypothetical protein
MFGSTLENTEGAIKNGQSRELATHSTQDDENQRKTTIQYELDSNIVISVTISA